MLVSKDIIENSTIQFGTSGARGLVENFTSTVCEAFTHAFIANLEENYEFGKVAVAIDNRPSSYAMAQACAAAILQRGYNVAFYGVIPTPALAYSAMRECIPCIMVTGSHIPFDRNGLKFYRPDGEINKLDERAILKGNVAFESSKVLPELNVDCKAAQQYLDRYSSLFDGHFLKGKRIGVYEHSSAGRDLYPSLFTALGAEVISLERVNEFVPIDTEAVSAEDKVKARNWSNKHNLDFIFSTDGDGDRPLVADENGEWLRGDILGLLCARELKVESLAIPVSCNTIIDSSPTFKKVVRTQIGSPYVIAEFSSLAEKYTSFCGFEANGGFLLGSDVKVNSKVLKALPTRDALLPALMLLSASKDTPIFELIKQLPSRYTHSERIQNFPTERSLSIIDEALRSPDNLLSKLDISEAYTKDIDTTDGLRLSLSDGVIIHLRPSGNAPELRCYVEAESLELAEFIVNRVLDNIKSTDF